jgi:GNAT superfamily N-acetyltransferase
MPHRVETDVTLQTLPQTGVGSYVRVMGQPIGGVLALENGERLLVRPIRPDDAAMVEAGFEKLDPESRRLRFFSPMPRLSPSLLRWMVNVDHRDHEALVAVLDGEPDHLVSVARYVRLKDRPTDAEVAVTVCQHRRRQGVATALLRLLRRAALANGIERFTGSVLPENRPAVAWLRSTGAVFDYSEPRERGFTVPLWRAPKLAPSPPSAAAS